MTEADGDHAPSQQAGVDTSSELADGGATAQLVQRVPATEVTEGTALAEPADAQPGSDEQATPMHTDLPTPTDKEMPSVNKPDQPASVAVIRVEALETAQPQAKLQSGRANVADAHYGTQSEAMAKLQSGLDHPALACAGSEAVPDGELADTTTPAEAAITSVPGTIAIQQEVGSTDVRDTSTCGFAQPDTDMAPVTSHGDQLFDYPMPPGQDPGSSKQTLPAALEAHSDNELRHDSEGAYSPSNAATPSSPTGIEM